MPDSWRQKIRLTEIMTRVQDCIFGNIDLTGEQLKAAQMILAKVVPDLARQELTGLNGGAIEAIVHASPDDKCIIERYLNQKEKHERSIGRSQQITGNKEPGAE